MLELKEIKERVANPKKKAELALAIEQERRIRFHSETALKVNEAGRAATDFLGWVEGLIPGDKFQIFKSLFRFPIQTVNVTSQAYEALQKIFDGRNPVFRYEFTSPDEKKDWAEYRKEKLREPWVWKNKGFGAMKTAINSVLVVDLPEEQAADRPEPYFYWLPLDRVIDYEEKDGELKALIFVQKNGRLAAFDDIYFRVFDYKDKELGALISEIPHGLGQCPARFFWDTPLSFRKPAVKRSPISDNLSDLDWLLFFGVSKQHLDLYAPYPIYSAFKQDCDYEAELETDEERQQVHCYRGYLRDDADNYIVTASGTLRPCPLCSTKRIAGVGSLIEIPPPAPENDKADLRNPVQITTIDRQSLDYNVGEVERLEARFLLSVTGYEGELLRNQALNEKQVGASFESRTNILSSVKKNFESAQEWTTTICCRLRYKTFQSTSISYGTDFYLETADSLLEAYLAAREKKADSMTLDDLQDQYFETKYRNNPEQLERQQIIVNLDPFRHLTVEEVTGLYVAKSIPFEEYYLKMNFSSLLLRMERENGSLLEIGANLQFQSRVAKMRETMLSYIVKPEPGVPAPV